MEKFALQQSRDIQVQVPVFGGEIQMKPFDRPSLGIAPNSKSEALFKCPNARASNWIHNLLIALDNQIRLSSRNEFTR